MLDLTSITLSPEDLLEEEKKPISICFIMKIIKPLRSGRSIRNKSRVNEKSFPQALKKNTLFLYKST